MSSLPEHEENKVEKNTEDSYCSDFTQSSSDTDSSSASDYEYGETFVYEISETAARFIRKNFGSEVDYHLTRDDEKWTCELITTPDNEEFHNLVFADLDATLNTWPFGMLAKKLAKETEEAFQTLFMDNVDRLLMIIEFCNLFENNASSSLEEVEALLDDETKIKALELHLREALELQDYLELDVQGFVEQLKTLYQEEDRWRKAGPFLAEKQTARLVPFLVAAALDLDKSDVLSLRLVSKEFKEKVDYSLVDNMYVQSRFYKNNFGIVESNDTRFVKIANLLTGKSILHCDKNTAKKLSPIVSISSDNDLSYLYQSEAGEELALALKQTPESSFIGPLEHDVSGEKWRLIQGTLKHEAFEEIFRKIIQLE
ncbi:unnamed protein product [Bursaphelenchus xylophilus]|uniref:(pine wood nematode) hypothetical protein n=1 Tax=Bursaphelenchus xylophilus TaxID=6326 RepID=A0A1I7SCJ1_BURXY|nr:unnamed protein product [Bursaphelenchus xylophilus]CAG9094011.1 unnamed protein product [Bursaphelenchus xylophilus]